MSEQPVTAAFKEQLKSLYEAAGRPDLATLVRQGARQKPPVELKDATLSDWLRGDSVPGKPKEREFRFLVAFLLARTGVKDQALSDQVQQWWQRWDAARRAGRRRTSGGRPQPPAPAATSDRPQMVPSLPPLIVRPGPVRELLAAVTAPPRRQPDVTVVRGTGGFGKTTLAAQAGHSQEVAAQYPGGVLWIELGEDVRGHDLAARINDLSERLTGARPDATDPQQAGFRLGDALAARRIRTLLIVDDVWFDDQIRPFLLGGPNCHRLATTRWELPALATAPAIQLDVMTDDEAAAMLAADQPEPLPNTVLPRLLRATGRWPLLLAITNRTIARFTTMERPLAEAAELVAVQLESAGPAGLDDPWTITTRQRHEMVGACLDASLRALPARSRDRYLELGIFPEGADIPYTVLRRLWSETGGLTAFQTEQLGQALVGASLATAAHHEPGLRLHDVLRSYVRDSAGPDRAIRANAALVAAAARVLGEAGAWWTLPDGEQYLWRHLIDHLTAAGLVEERDDLVTDLRWTAERIRRDGPAYAEADLVNTRRAEAAALVEALRHNADLLAHVTPASSLDDILASRLDGTPELQPKVATFVRTLTNRPRLSNRWRPPGQPDRSLRRAIHTGHERGVRHVQIAPDGEWLATSGSHDRGRHPDRILRIWNPATGSLNHEIDAGHPNGIGRLLIAEDGRSIFTVGHTEGQISTLTVDPVVRIWDPATGRLRLEIETGHPRGVDMVDLSPDGTWLATTGRTDSRPDRFLRIWDATTGTRRHRLLGDGSSGARHLRIGPLGDLLVAAGGSVVRVWDPASGQLRLEIDLGRDGASDMLLAPDATWLATTSHATTRDDRHKVVRIWNLATGTERSQLHTEHPRGVGQLHTGPDGTWLATADAIQSFNYGVGDPAVQVWDLDSGTQRLRLETGHQLGLGQLRTAPDGTWLVTTGNRHHLEGDPVVRIWDLATGELRNRLDTDHLDGIGEMLIARDGTWLATAGQPDGVGNRRADPIMQIWDTATGERRHRIGTSHPEGVARLHMSSSGDWLATTGGNAYGGDPIVRVWNPAGRAKLVGEDGPRAGGLWQLRASPDGTYLATAGMFSDSNPMVCIWDTRSGMKRHYIDTGHAGGVRDLLVAPDSTWLVTTGETAGYVRKDDPTVRIWDPITGLQRQQLDTGYQGVGDVLIAPHGRWMITTGGARGEADQTARVWDTVSGRPLHELKTGNSRGGLRLAPDGTWLIAFPYFDEAQARIWSTTDWTLLGQVELGHSFGVGHVKIAPDSSFLVTRGRRADGNSWPDDHKVWVRYLASGAEHWIETDHWSGVRDVAIAPDASWMATIGVGTSKGDGVVQIWDPATGVELGRLTTDHRPPGIGEVRIAPDGTWLATIGRYDRIYNHRDPVVEVWDPATGERIDQVDTCIASGLRQLLIGPDSTWLAVVGDDAVSVWCREQPTQAAMRIGSTIRACAVAPRGRVIFVVSAAGLHGFDVQA